MTVDCDVHQGNGTAVIFGNAATQGEPAALDGRRRRWGTARARA